jgi:hypothetical protein
MIQDKIKKNHTYLIVSNYWTPLNDNNEESKEDEEEANTIQKNPATTQQKSNKWTRQIARQKEHKQINDFGATSHLMSKDLYLPTEGTSNKTAFLPDNRQLRMSNKTKLPFDQLLDAAGEANVLPGLKKSLLSVNKMSEEGYTTVFHPGSKGVTNHKQETNTIKTSEPLVLQGCKSNTEKLWMAFVEKDEVIQEETHNVYSLLSIPQTITYLHAAARYPVKDTWINAIKEGKVVTRPGQDSLQQQSGSTSLNWMKQ